MKYDILLKGGTVVDPTQKLHDRRDVAVIDGKIAAIEDDISAREATQTVFVEDKYVTPA